MERNVLTYNQTNRITICCIDGNDWESLAGKGLFYQGHAELIVCLTVLHHILYVTVSYFLPSLILSQGSQCSLVKCLAERQQAVSGRGRIGTWIFWLVFSPLPLVLAKSLQLCLTLCDPMDCSPLGSSVHGIFQARILEWVAVSFSRWSPWPRDRTWVSCTAGRVFTNWATREAQSFFFRQTIFEILEPLVLRLNLFKANLRLRYNDQNGWSEREEREESWFSQRQVLSDPVFVL